MNPIRRLTAALAGLAGALLAFAAAAPAALAIVPAPSARLGQAPAAAAGHVAGPVLGPNRAGYPPISHVHTVVVGGMPGWQIALIAIGAALLAATAAVLAGPRMDRPPQDDHRGCLSRARRLAEAGEDARLLPSP